METRTHAVVGGGAAGIFGAIAAASRDRSAKVLVLEATDQLLDKVRISGGGRCNVTHNCFDPVELVKNYPRGARELRSVFSRFQPRDTVEWFESHGVKLKVESDGRMFPVTDNSATICDCLVETAVSLGIEIRRQCRVKEIHRHPVNVGARQFDIHIHNKPIHTCDRVLIATGSSPQGYRFAESLGHSIVPCVPSLFTFKVSDARLEGLSGVSFPHVDLTLMVNGKSFRQSGPMLITHWGLSGPAVLKLSAFAARELAGSDYRAELSVNITPTLREHAITRLLTSSRENYGRKQVHVDSPFVIPKRYWNGMIHRIGVPNEKTWSELTKHDVKSICHELTSARFEVAGKGIFKEEFVTCGGVNLREIDFQHMASRRCPGLFFAGEVLDIDGLTGGFNLQAAWSTGWIAGEGMASASNYVDEW